MDRIRGWSGDKAARPEHVIDQRVQTAERRSPAAISVAMTLKGALHEQTSLELVVIERVGVSMMPSSIAGTSIFVRSSVEQF